MIAEVEDEEDERARKRRRKEEKKRRKAEEAASTSVSEAVSGAAAPVVEEEAEDGKETKEEKRARKAAKKAKKAAEATSTTATTSMSVFIYMCTQILTSVPSYIRTILSAFEIRNRSLPLKTQYHTVSAILDTTICAISIICVCTRSFHLTLGIRHFQRAYTDPSMRVASAYDRE